MRAAVAKSILENEGIGRTRSRMDPDARTV